MRKKNSIWFSYQNGFLNVNIYITKNCIFNCKYCFVKKNKNDVMSWKTAKKTVDYIISLNADRPQITFFGGEPLLKFNLIKQITEYAESKGINRFNIATNIILINESILDYFKEHNFVPQISIDGEKIAYDKERLFSDGRGSFDIFNNKLQLISKHFKGYQLSIRITFTPNTVKFLSKSVLYIIENKLTWPQVRINIVPVVNYKLKWEDKHFDIFKREIHKVAKIFLYYIKKRLYLNICSSECVPEDFHLVNLVKLKNGFFHPEFICYTGRSQMMIDTNGNIFPCCTFEVLPARDKYKYLFGNVYKGIIHCKRYDDYIKTAINPHLSCCAYNVLLNGNPSFPNKVYSKIFAHWMSASEFVNKQLQDGKDNFSKTRTVL